MLKRLLLATFATAVAVGIGYADQPTTKVVIPVKNTAPTSGKQMYISYCAPCHGVDGRGNGPVATSLKREPSDLTVLSRKNHGKFPDTHIVAVLQFGTDVPSHGTAQMPVWGPILGKMNQSSPQQRILRISNLSRYLESMQER